MARSGSPFTSRPSETDCVRPAPNASSARHTPPWVTIGAGIVTIEIVAHPGASRRRTVRVEPRGLVIALNSAAEKGKANEELVQYLAAELKVPRKAIAIVRGEISRRKTIRISPCDAAAVTARLAVLAGAEV